MATITVRNIPDEVIELIAPNSWYSEFLNVLWQAVRFQGIYFDHGLELLEEVESLLY